MGESPTSCRILQGDSPHKAAESEQAADVKSLVEADETSPQPCIASDSLLIPGSPDDQAPRRSLSKGWQLLRQLSSHVDNEESAEAAESSASSAEAAACVSTTRAVSPSRFATPPLSCTRLERTRPVQRVTGTGFSPRHERLGIGVGFDRDPFPVLEDRAAFERQESEEWDDDSSLLSGRPASKATSATQPVRRSCPQPVHRKSPIASAAVMQRAAAAAAARRKENETARRARYASAGDADSSSAEHSRSNSPAVRPRCSSAMAGGTRTALKTPTPDTRPASTTPEVQRERALSPCHSPGSEGPPGSARSTSRNLLGSPAPAFPTSWPCMQPRDRLLFGLAMRRPVQR